LSDLLRLATDLKGRSNESLVALLQRRNIAGAPKDFFDLAQALLNPKSIQAAIVKLAASEADALNDLVENSGHQASDIGTAGLIELGLIYTDAKGAHPYEVTAEIARPILAGKDFIQTKTAAISIIAEIDPSAEPDRSTLGLAAIAAFETQQAITELVLDVEQHLVRQVGKSGFGVADVKRLAAHLRRTNTQVRGYFVLAHQLRMVELIGDRWWLTNRAEAFLAASMIERWSMLANQWIASLGSVGARQLRQLLTIPTNDIAGALRAVFPLADANLGDEIEVLLEQAQGIGFSVAGAPTALLTLCLEGKGDIARDLLQPHLPQLQHSLIVQADLSLIAPGPLDTPTETILRKFAQIEQVSVASTYRLSALSVSNGLECGLSAEQIRTVLTDLSAKALPQPVEYLLNEAAGRFGRLRIAEGKTGAERSILSSTDGILLTEILNDSRLRPFAFYALSAGTLATRFEPEVVYFGLRDYGYVPVRIDAQGAVISPEKTGSWGVQSEGAEADPLLALIGAIRSADERVGAQPDDQDLTRQIQLAIKNKTALSVALTDRSGNEVEFRILPTALVNGRLRGLDKKADIERTLPLERILRVAIG
jgi:hypothetical protein